MNPRSNTPSSASASSIHTSVPPYDVTWSFDGVTCPSDQTADPFSNYGANLEYPAGSFEADMHPSYYANFAARCWIQAPYDHDFSQGVESTPTGLLNSSLGHHSSAYPYHRTDQPTPSFLSQSQPQISFPSPTFNSVNDQRFLGDPGASLLLSTVPNAGGTSQSAWWSSMQANHMEGQPRDMVSPVANSGFIQSEQGHCDTSAIPSETHSTKECSGDTSCPDGTCDKAYSTLGNLVRHYRKSHKNAKLSGEDAKLLAERRPPMDQCEECGQLIPLEGPKGEVYRQYQRRHNCKRSACGSSAKAKRVEGQPKDMISRVANSSFSQSEQEHCDRSDILSETQPTKEWSGDSSCPDGTCDKAYSTLGNLFRHYRKFHKNAKLLGEDARRLAARRPPLDQCKSCGQLTAPDGPKELPYGRNLKQHECQRV